MKPVLLFCFNRPTHTKKVLNRLKELGVTDLYINVDAVGERWNTETKSYEPAFHTDLVDLLSNYDYGKMEVKFNWLNENKGCKDGPLLGMKWFFNQVPEGVVLDDDCLPNRTFFEFVDQMLDKYRNDKSVVHIAGYTPINMDCHSYYFSRFTFNWGWATWANKFDFHAFMQLWQSDLRGVELTDLSKVYLQDKFEKVITNKLQAWDYLWLKYVIDNRYKAIVPCKNMIQNIGFDQGTHTVGKTRLMTTFEYDIVHPKEVGDCIYDQDLFYASQKSKFRLPLWYIRKLTKL